MGREDEDGLRVGVCRLRFKPLRRGNRILRDGVVGAVVDADTRDGEVVEAGAR